MSTRTWTEEQSKVITLRNRNILVSAAAGSGKTAVLVERILKKITEGENPPDIDHLLVVTFTKAAAAEMRERIGMAIEERLKGLEADKEQQRERLLRQSSLLYHAQISTIDSFCKQVVEEHFHEIDIDPVFRIADEAELVLLKSELIKNLLEEYYEAGEEEFFTFAEQYATGKNDDFLEQCILQMFQFAESFPDPKGWLEREKKDYAGSMEKARFMKPLLDYLKEECKSLLELNQLALSICAQKEGPFHYEETLQSDRIYLTQLAKAQSYEEYAKAFSDISFITLSRKRPKVDEEKKDQVKQIRDQIKKAVNTLREEYFFQGVEQMEEDFKHTVPGILMALRLTGDFMEKYQEAKAKKNIVDFADLEHFALKILLDEKGEPTSSALEYRDYFEEILIDEYQDSNLIQEKLLTSISKETDGRPNIFMVGDVKQSIYKFRQARPELFMEKYASYTKEDSLYQKIDLHKNFRSRQNVVESTNDIFFSIMKKELGGVCYDEDAALHLGASYPPLSKEEEKSFQTELLLMDETDEEEEEPIFLRGADSKEKEASLVAKRILRLKRESTFSYGDMVILLRTMSGWSETFLRVLNAEGIPAVSDTASGYFSAWEVQIVLNVLRILDNPRQDIPLASVLLSPIGGVSEEQLAKYRAFKKKGRLWDAVLGQEEMQDFFDWYQKKRKALSYTPIHVLLQEIYEETGFYTYVLAMPAGSRRGANLIMLVEKAIEFEKTSFHGLFHFVRYIEKLHKYEVDFGEAYMGENEDAVRIMSIHKSKGLEFPVVFVCGLGKKFNEQDARASLVIHPEYGLAVDDIDIINRTKAPTLPKKVLARQLVLDNLGEELRVLYVAFTRAREKLILTGITRRLQDRLLKWNTIPITFHSLSRAMCYLDFIMPAISSKPEHFLVLLYTERDLKLEEGMDVTVYGGWQQKFLTEVQKAKEQEKKEEEEGIQRIIEEELSKEYCYKQIEHLKTKITVSDLKRLALQEEEAGEVLEAAKKELLEHVIPRFANTKPEMEGTVRGTLYHWFLEHLDFSKEYTRESLSERIEELLRAQKLTEKEAAVLNRKKLLTFLHSPIAKRMRQAQLLGKLHKESPFVLGVLAKELYPEIENEELILVQGIIDIYFEEEDGLVLVDYKTDRIAPKEEEVLKERYQTQLHYYEKALNQLTGKKVKEKFIYSFALLKEIKL